MNFLLVKLKKEYRRSSLRDTIFDEPDLRNSRKYDPRNAVPDCDWYYLDNIKDKEYYNEILIEEDSLKYPMLVSKNFSEITIIMDYHDNGFLCIQNITPSIIFRKRLLQSDQTIMLPNNNLVINDVPDVIYDKSRDRLYFKKLSSIKILPGISIEYREATDTEVIKFIEKTNINLENGYDVSKIKIKNRKLLNLVLEKIESLPDNLVTDLINYVAKTCPKYSLNNNFVISNEKEMNELLMVFDERQYITPVTKEKRIANSVEKIE